MFYRGHLRGVRHRYTGRLPIANCWQVCPVEKLRSPHDLARRNDKSLASSTSVLSSEFVCARPAWDLTCYRMPIK